MGGVGNLQKKCLSPVLSLRPRRGKMYKFQEKELKENYLNLAEASKGGEIPGLIVGGGGKVCNELQRKACKEKRKEWGKKGRALDP